jgi:dynein heavy chain
MQPWPTNFDKPSDLYKLVVNNSQHPPLMQSKSWNLAVPFREQRFSHTPSESIANNYTPTANDLKIKNLNRLINSKQKLKSLDNINNTGRSLDNSFYSSNVTSDSKYSKKFKKSEK